MKQHFLLSAAARTLSVLEIARLDDEEAWNLFRAIRWADTDGEPVCPECGCMASYRHKSREIFSCQACGRQFSVTSGTIFDNHKLPLRDLLTAIAIFVNAAKGISALQLSRDLNVQYRTAYVLAHKLREALGADIADRQAAGVVEVDGAYFGGYVKPSNWVDNRRDRRKAENQTGKRQVVVIARERGGRTLPFVVKQEAQAVPILDQVIKVSATIHADEAYGWDPLHTFHKVKRINHQEAYSDGDACTNQAESFFSRLRRAEFGTHHRIAGPYLGYYAREQAWREDARQIPNGEQFLLVILASLDHAISTQWRGYWDRWRADGKAQGSAA